MKLIGGCPRKPATNLFAGSLEQFQGRAMLLDHTGIHYDDPVRKRHALDLVVRHVDHRIAERGMQLGGSSTRISARSDASRLESGSSKRNSLGLRARGPSDRYALALTARERRGLRDNSISSFRSFAISRTRSSMNAFFSPAIFKPEADIFRNCHMGIERIALENHCNPTLDRRCRCDVDAILKKLAGRNRLQTGNASKQSRFPAAGRADLHHEFPVLDGKTYVMDNIDGAEGLVDIFELKVSPRVCLD